MNIGIVGLGLIGGSFALSIKKHYENINITGYDHNKNHQKEALSLKLVDKIAKDFDEIKKSDIIILAIPVEGIIKALQNLQDIPKTTTIIDMGSTKERIVQNTPKSIRNNFIAAHPMAGTEKTGPTAAFSDLYEDKVVVLCNLEENSDFHKKRAIELFTKINMKIIYMDAKEHDLHAAYISHMPHGISFAIAQSVMKQENRNNILALAGGGFASMSRLAKSSPVMWSDIFKQNKKNLLTALDSFSNELKSMREMVENEDWENLQKWMAEANRLHDII